jgi:hypothetical protein
MADDPVMAYDVFHAFNQWLDEDWSYNYHDRLYAPPYIPMLDPELAAKELDFVLEKGAKVVSIRPGPAGGRSPADPVWDPFWSRMNESKTLAAYHAFGGPTVYGDALQQMWGRTPVTDPLYQAMLSARRSPTAASSTPRWPGPRQPVRPLPERAPRASRWVASGSVRAGDARPCRWDARSSHRSIRRPLDDLPSDVFKEKVYVSPFPEEDVVGLTEPSVSITCCSDPTGRTPRATSLRRLRRVHQDAERHRHPEDHARERAVTAAIAASRSLLHRARNEH